MFENTTHFFRQMKLYALGKGLVTLSVFAAAAIGAATGIGVIVPAIVAGVGGFALTVAQRLHSASLYEETMLNLYRDNIADQLGIAPEAVTPSHLREAARDNEIIDQALKRQDKKTILAIGTAALAAIVSVGLIMAFGFDHTLHSLADESLAGSLKPLAGFVGVGTVASLSSLVIHEGLDALIGHKAGLSKAAAHDLIYQMDLAVKRGISISREEVFGVMVAGDGALHDRITRQYGKEYSDMGHGEKSRVLHDLNLATVMDKLALAISDKKIRAGYLAYAADDPHLTAPRATQQVDATSPTLPTPRSSFVERLGLMPNEERTSHAERLATAQQSRDALPPL